MKRRSLAPILIVAMLLLSIPAVASPRRDEPSAERNVIARFLSKIVRSLEDIRIGPPIP